jgi:hypothetical protein
MRLDLKKMAAFLVKAKINTYAADGKETSPQRKGFRELEFSDGDFYYRDSYSGYFCAPGQEVVYFKEVPVWTMAYAGGMSEGFQKNKKLTGNTFKFLKKVLSRVEESRPFRGPKSFSEGEWTYKSSVKGDITNFEGREKIFYRKKEVFTQKYMGGLIIHK